MTKTFIRPPQYDMCMLPQVRASLELATELQLDRLRAHALLAAARQLISSRTNSSIASIMEAAQIPEGNSWLMLGVLAAAVKQAPDGTRQHVLNKLPAASEVESWMLLHKQAGGEFVWEIEGFSGKDGLLLSPRFSIGSYDWWLQCHPKGDPVKEAEGHMSLYLELAPEFRDPGG